MNDEKLENYKELLKAAKKVLNENWDILFEGEYGLEIAIDKAKDDLYG